MTASDVENLSSEEKFQLLDAIWKDFRTKFENFEIPENHQSMLDERRQRAEAGESEIHDWEKVKSTIGRV